MDDADSVLMQTWVSRGWDELQPLFCGYDTWFAGGWGKITGPLPSGTWILFHGDDNVLDCAKTTACAHMCFCSDACLVE